MNINQVGAALSAAVAGGAAGDLPVVISVGGVEKHIGQIIYVKGDIILQPSQSSEADRLVLKVNE